MWQTIQELQPREPLDYNLKYVMEAPDDFKNKVLFLKETTFDRKDQKLKLGEWVDFTLRESYSNGSGKTKLATSLPIEAYKSVFIDDESPYFIPEGIDPDLYTVYNAFTQVITDDNKKNFFNDFEKTMLVTKLFGL
jgi:hypothetical protein